MQAVILAAGKGTRIFPFSTSKAKPLIEVANKPVLMHNLDQMLGIVDEAIIIVGYKKDQIMQALGEHYHSIKITYIVQEEMLGTGHALLMAEGKVTGKFFAFYGDDLYSRKDMKNLAKFDNAVLLQHKDDVSKFGAVVVENGLVKEVIEKPQGPPPSNLVNAGMFCFTPEIFPILRSLKLSPRGEYELTDAMQELAKQGKLHYQEVQGFWIPVGYPWHILEANEQMLADEELCSIKGKLEEGVMIEGSVDIAKGAIVKSGTLLKGNIVIGENTVIGPNCIITGSTAIGKNCIIEASCGIENSVIASNSKLGKRCMIKDSVLGEHVELSPGVRIENKGKNNNGTVKVRSAKKTFDSGREKLGAFVGDKSKVKKALEPGDCVQEDQQDQ